MWKCLERWGRDGRKESQTLSLSRGFLEPLGQRDGKLHSPCAPLAEVQQFNNCRLSSVTEGGLGDGEDNAGLHFRGEERKSGEGFTKLDGIRLFWAAG